MSSSDANPPLGDRPASESENVGLLQEVDACCDRYEKEWLAGAAPETEEFAATLSDELRRAATRELVLLEWHYRGGKDDPLGVRAALVGRKKLANLLADCGAALEDVLDGVAPSLAMATRPFSPSASEALHLRCPHCQNGVELLADAPLEQITCASCGSTFGLVGDNQQIATTAKKIARFVLVDRLGVGGFGAVWRARDPELDRDVAIKIPRGSQLLPQERELFFREARAAAQLAHPHIVPVHEVGRDGESIFIVSELIHGEPLSERLKQRRPTAHETASLLATIADALHYAHEKGVVHRDMKPSNVMLDGEGAPHVMDFGLAKRDVGEITMTVEGQVLGTPAYMSPEQAEGNVRWVDRRTDVYALGVMLFQMLTGELPFRGTAQSQIQQRLSDDPPSPRRIDAHAPRDLATVCLKCLERDPNRRYSTAAGLAEELRRYLRGEPVLARPLSRVERTLRWAKRRPASATAIVVGALLAVAGPLAAVGMWQWGRAVEQRLNERVEYINEAESKIDFLQGEKDDLAAQLEGLRRGDDGLGPTLPMWRKQIITDFVTDRGDEIVARLAKLDPSSRAATTARIGYARLCVVAGEIKGAIEHLTEAERLLAERVEAASPEGEGAWLGAWAACHYELSVLLGEQGEKDRAREHAAQAVAIRKRLADTSPGELNSQVDLLASLVDRRNAGTPDVAREDLDALANAAYAPQLEAIKKIEQSLSTVPDRLYEQAELLLRRRATIEE